MLVIVCAARSPGLGEQPGWPRSGPRCSLWCVGLHHAYSSCPSARWTWDLAPDSRALALLSLHAGLLDADTMPQ